MLADEQADFFKFKVPTKPQYALVTSLGAIFLLRRNTPTLVAPAILQQKVYGEKGMAELGGLTDLSSNAILDRGSIIGLWEYDPEASPSCGSPSRHRTSLCANASRKPKRTCATSWATHAPSASTPRRAGFRGSKPSVSSIESDAQGSLAPRAAHKKYPRIARIVLSCSRCFCCAKVWNKQI